MNSKKYNFKEYLIKKSNLKEDYVDDMIDYYKKSYFDHLMISPNSLSSYRQKLLDLVTFKKLINEDGIIDKDVIQEDDNNWKTIEIDRSNGFLNFVLFQYEHDKKIDEFNKQYNTNNFDFSSFFNGDMSKKQKNYDKYELFKFNQDNECENNRTVINFKKLIFSYGYKTQKTYTGLGEWNDNLFIIKINTSLNNPAIPIIDLLMQTGNINIRILSKKTSTVFVTLSGTKHLDVMESGWTINVED